MFPSDGYLGQNGIGSHLPASKCCLHDWTSARGYCQKDVQVTRMGCSSSRKNSRGPQKSISAFALYLKFGPKNINSWFFDLQPFTLTYALSQYDPSLMVKFGLTFGYFESVVSAMGSKRHKHFLKALQNNEVNFRHILYGIILLFM